MEKRKSAFIVAGTNSGAGKTVLTLGLMGELKRRGLSVQPFKAGPDYIDPGHHRALLKRPSYNLDTWMMGKEGVLKTFSRAMSGADIGVIEGVMGLYDGRDGVSEEGSTAHLSKIINSPVLLVVNAEKTARSAGAVIKGFESYDPRVKIRWVVFNRVGSARHYGILKDSIPKGSGARVIGYLPKDADLSMPERHLGLTTAGDLDRAEWKRFVKKASSIVRKHIDVDSLLGSMPLVKTLSVPDVKKQKPSVRVAVALDRAFCFYYEENLDVLESSGAEVVFFSPLNDRKLPEGTCGVYLGGGYPELYAKELSANRALKSEILKKAKEGMPVYAECGGLMYLGGAIDDDGRLRKTVGLFPWTSRMLKKRKALGYREVRFTDDCPFVKTGSIRGHEFHYSEITRVPAKVKRAFRFTTPAGVEAGEGYTLKNALASYMHLHFSGNTAFAEGFIGRCAEFASARKVCPPKKNIVREDDTDRVR